MIRKRSKPDVQKLIFNPTPNGVLSVLKILKTSYRYSVKPELQKELERLKLEVHKLEQQLEKTPVWKAYRKLQDRLRMEEQKVKEEAKHLHIAIYTNGLTSEKLKQLQKLCKRAGIL